MKTLNAAELEKLKSGIEFKLNIFVNCCKFLGISFIGAAYTPNNDFQINFSEGYVIFEKFNKTYIEAIAKDYSNNILGVIKYHNNKWYWS